MKKSDQALIRHLNRDEIRALLGGVAFTNSLPLRAISQVLGGMLTRDAVQWDRPPREPATKTRGNTNPLP